MKLARGQSLVEFAAGVAALGLLALGTIAIASYQESQRRLVVAARQAAFELEWRNNRPARAAEREQLFDIHFADPGLAVPVSGRRLLRVTDVQVRNGRRQLSGQAAATETVLTGTLNSPGGGLGGGIDPGSRGLREVRIDAAVQPMPELPAPFRTIAVPMWQSMVLLADSWSASDPRQVSHRVGGLVPSSALQPIATLLRPLAVPLALLEPSLTSLCIGLIDADGVPEDRLSVGARASWNSCR